MEEGAISDHLVINTSDPSTVVSSTTIRQMRNLAKELKEMEELFCKNLDKIFSNPKRLDLFVKLIKVLPFKFFAIARQLNFDIAGPEAIDAFLLNYSTNEEKLKVLCTMVSQIVARLLLDEEMREDRGLITIGIVFDVLATSESVSIHDLITMYFALEKNPTLSVFLDPSNNRSMFVRKLAKIRIDFLTHLFYWLLYTQYFTTGGKAGVFFRLSNNHQERPLSQRTPNKFYNILLSNYSENDINNFGVWWKGQDKQTQLKEESRDHFLPFRVDVTFNGYEALSTGERHVPTESFEGFNTKCKLIFTKMREIVSEFVAEDNGVRAIVGGVGLLIMHVPCIKLFSCDSWPDVFLELAIGIRYYLKQSYYTEAEHASHFNDQDEFERLVPAPKLWLDSTQTAQIETAVSAFLLNAETPRFWEYYITILLLLFDQHYALKFIGYHTIRESPNFPRIAIEDLSFSKVLQLCLYKSKKSNISFPNLRRELARRVPALGKFLFDVPHFFANFEEIKVFWAGMQLGGDQ